MQKGVIESVSRSRTFKYNFVTVPPKVSPFYAEDTLHVGDRASLTCSVTKGDLPLTISWHKDARTIEPSHTISITQVDQFTSILVIDSLSPEHNGNYSCVVTNFAATVSHTQQLVVNGNSTCARATRFFLLFFSFLSLMFVSLVFLSVPPIIEPFSFQDGLSEGMRTRTVCGVSKGDPPLIVSWLKDGQPLTPNLGVNVSALDPYSSLLSISSLDSRHSGDFTCVASNPASEVRYTAKLQVKGNHPSLSPFQKPLPTPKNTIRCFGTCVNWTQWSRYCCTDFVNLYLPFFLFFQL